MSKLLVIPSNKNIKELDKYADAYLFGIKNLSVNMPFYIDIEELKEIKTDKEIFISLNKNMQNKNLEVLEQTLKELDNLNIKGVFYYDAAIVRMKKRLNLNLDLVWDQEHLTTNYKTADFWYEEGSKYTCLSSEITLREIEEIIENTKAKIMVQLFGYIPIFVSFRHTVDNYLDTFDLKDNSKINYMNMDNDNYPIVDDNLGTNIYSANILNGYKEYLDLDKKLEYTILNSFNIDENKFLEVLKIFKLKEKDNIDTLFTNIDKEFLYKETIYKVKK